MASYDPAMNSATPTAKGQGAAFGPIQAPSVAAQGAPMTPGGSPGGSPGMPPGSVAPGAFPQGLPPNLANILMGMNPNQPTPNVVPGGVPGNPGGMGSPAGGAFSSGFAPGQSTANHASMMRGQTPNNGGGAFGRMGPTTGTPSWASQIAPGGSK